MIVDALLVIGGVSAAVFGFKRGFLHALLTTVGYIGGGILGLVIALHYVESIKSTTNKFLIVFFAIVVAASVGERVGKSLAVFFRTRILWSPIRFVDSLAGVALELVRVTVISFLGLTVLLGAPWNFAKTAVSESKIYKEMVQHEPSALHKFRAEIEKKLSIIPRY